MCFRGLDSRGNNDIFVYLFMVHKFRILHLGLLSLSRRNAMISPHKVFEHHKVPLRTPFHRDPFPSQSRLSGGRGAFPCVACVKFKNRVVMAEEPRHL